MSAARYGAMSAVFHIVLGLVFGLLLSRSGAADYGYIQAMFRFEHIQLYGIIGVAVLVFKRSHVIPYGPFLSLGLVLALFWGADVLRVTGMEETVQALWSYYGWR